MNRSRIFLTFAAMVLGFLVVTQYREAVANRLTMLSSTPASLAVDNAQLYRAKQRLDADLIDLKQQQADLELIANSSVSTETAVEDTVQAYKALSGLTAVSGPGVTITINRRLETVELVDLMNVLRGLDAEAISINNERILISTPLDSAHFGDHLIIRAIGPTDSLQSGLSGKHGMLEQLSRGINENVQLQTAATLTIPIANSQPIERRAQEG